MRAEACAWKRTNGERAFTVSVLPFHRSNAVERWNGKRFWKRFFDVYCSYNHSKLYLLPIHYVYTYYMHRELCSVLFHGGEKVVPDSG